MSQIRDRVVRNLLSLFEDVGQGGDKRLRKRQRRSTSRGSNNSGGMDGISNTIESSTESKEISENTNQSDKNGRTETTFQDVARQLAIEEKERGGWTIRTFIHGVINISKGANPKYKYYSGAIRRGGLFSDDEILSKFKTKRTDHLWAFIVEEDDHYHIVHACSLSDQSCRCWGYRLGTRNAERGLICGKQTRDWKNIFKYFFENGSGKRPLYGKFRIENNSGLFIGCKILQSEGDTSNILDIKRYVEECSTEDENLWNSEESGRSDYEELSLEDGTHSQRSTKKRKHEETFFTKKDKKVHGIVNILLKIGAAPIQEGIKSSLFNSTEFKYNTEYELPCKIATLKVKEHFQFFTIGNYVEYYKTTKFLNNLPIWHCYNHEYFNKVYMNEIETDIYLKKLLIWQWCGTKYFNEEYETINDDWKEEFYGQVKMLIKWLNCSAGKKNTWYIESPPNAGKSMFTDLICDFLLNTGSITNWNKHHSFPLQMCDRVRLMVWNEPNFESSALDDLKKLTAGDLLSFNVKNRNHSQIQAIPLLITANRYIFPKDRIFNTRIYKETWQSAPFLQDIKDGKRFYPLSLITLFKEAENYFEEDLMD